MKIEMKTFKNDAFSATAEAQNFTLENTSRVKTARSLFVAPTEQVHQYTAKALAFA